MSGTPQTPPEPMHQSPPYPPPGYAPPMLQYAGLDLWRRPGILTALAICSIIFGSLGLLYNGLATAAGVYELAIASDWGTTTGTTPSLGGTSADTTPPDTLSESDAQIIVAALANLQPLSDDEQRRLAEAIRRTESPVAPPLEGVPWSVLHVQRQVIQSATRLPGQSYEDEDDIEDDLFSDGQDQGAEDEQGDDEAQEPEPPVYEEREIHFDFDMNGDIWIYEDRVHLYAMPMDGRYLDSIVYSDGRIEVDDSDALYDDQGWETARLWLTLASSMLALGLAVLLLVAGILTLRGRPSAPRLHRLWAWSRIALSLLVAGLTAWAATQVFDPSMGDMFLMVMVMVVAVQLVLSMAYPVAVLIVLRLPRVRNWYVGSQSGQPLRPAVGQQPAM